MIFDVTDPELREIASDHKLTFEIPEDTDDWLILTCKDESSLGIQEIFLTPYELLVMLSKWYEQPRAKKYDRLDLFWSPILSGLTSRQ